MKIYVEIEVPVLGNIYDFKLESSETIGVLLEEILSAIRQKEQCSFEEHKENFVLCFPDKEVLLHPKKRLADCEIVTASRLLLV